MTLRLFALCVDANDPLRLARFWAAFLGWKPVEGRDDEIALVPDHDPAFRIRFLPTREQKASQNQMHVDLTSTSLDDQREVVARALRLGAEPIDIGQRSDEGHVVLADPEGNEFCVIEPGNTFLADCGFIGALACDGTQQVGYFWSAALGWPLVWDQRQETAIRSPLGGPKITWGGLPVLPPRGNNRLHFDLAPCAGGDHREEVERLLSLGATQIDVDRHGLTCVVLADPDGNEFCLLNERGSR